MRSKTGLQPMKESRELVIIGGGPAGMSAAIRASTWGVDVLLLDQREAPGGQIYRRVESPALADPTLLGDDYLRGADLVALFRKSTADFRPDTVVWEVSRKREVYVYGGTGPRIIEARRVILATGALERPFPIPGWTLPGVMPVGGAQSLIKNDGLLPEGPVVLAGTGPLLLLLACQYLDMGVEVAAVLETTPRSNLKRAVAHLPGAMMAGGYLAKGVGLLARLRRAGIRHVRGVEALRAVGSDHLQQIAFHAKGREHHLDASLLLLHQGVVPDVNLASTVGCALQWDKGALCFKPRVDQWGNSNVDGVAVIGDGAAIVGAHSAKWIGELAGLEAACQLGYIDANARDAQAQKFRNRYRRSLGVRPFLETLYRPPDAFRIPEDPDVVICRCEEVTAKTVREQIGHGAQDPNAIKSRTRCGMGPCQGRYCGLTVSEIIAAETGREISGVGYFRLRPPVKPLPISAILELATGEMPAETALPDPTGEPRS
jgi:thioredoxin reductase/bacterioferritin-associated ferredoxin